MQALLVGALQARDHHGPTVFCGEVTEMQTPSILYSQSAESVGREPTDTKG